MDPIWTLTEEHRAIERVLDAFHVYLLGLEETSRPTDLMGFVTFLRGFADGCHQGKEEEILFEELIERGAMRENGPIEVMEHEHEEARRLLESLADFAEKTHWSGSDVDRVGVTGRAYVGLLRSHIEKEDQVIFPLAERLIGEPARQRIGEKMERYELEESGNGEHGRLIQLGDWLVARYGGGPAYEARL